MTKKKTIETRTASYRFVWTQDGASVHVDAYLASNDRKIMEWAYPMPPRLAAAEAFYRTQAELDARAANQERRRIQRELDREEHESEAAAAQDDFNPPYARDERAI